MNAARQAESAGKLQEALAIYDQALKLDGRSIPVLLEQSRVAVAAKDMHTALASAAKLASVGAGDPGVAKHAASIFMRFARPDKALAVIGPHTMPLADREAVQLGFEAAYQLNKGEEAERLARALVAVAPDDALAWYSLGRATDVPRRRMEAAEHYARSIGTGHAPATVYVSHAWTQTFQTAPFYWNDLLERGKAKTTPDRSAILVAIGKIAGDLGDTDAAIESFLESKREFASQSQPVSYEAQVARLKGHFDRAFFDLRRSLGNRSERPVFIVGMPRSGTTLIEQILAAHPEVAGAGELMFFENEVAQLSRGLASMDGFLDRASALKQRDLASMASEYLTLLRAFSPEAKRVVDKMPGNFERLWLISLVFPNAKIIHCRRDPIATCVSCLTNPLSPKHSYTADLDLLGSYYCAYADLMDHWMTALPTRILQVDYESVIDDFEANARRLVEFVGLEWSDECLRFHEQSNLVLTPSRHQVGQGIYKGANESWRRYEPRLRVLVDSLAKCDGRRAASS